MISVTLKVGKAGVYDEVAKTTSYTGSKMGEKGAYERIFATDDDRLMLERFWQEACSEVTERLKPFIAGVSSLPDVHGVDLSDDFEVHLSLSGSFDTNLVGSMESSLRSYFVLYIVSRWYKFTNKGESESYAADASLKLDDVLRKVWYRKRPVRRVPG